MDDVAANLLTRHLAGGDTNDVKHSSYRCRFRLACCRR